MEDVKIYEVPHFIQEAMEASMDEDGNLDQELYGDMVELILGSEPVEKKLEGIRYHLLNIEQKKELADNERVRLEKTIKAYNSQQSNLKRYIIEIMNVSNITTLDAGTVTFRSITNENGEQDITVESEPIVQREIEETIKPTDIEKVLIGAKGKIEDVEIYDSIMPIILNEKQSFPDKLNELRSVMLKYSSRHDILKKRKRK